MYLNVTLTVHSGHKSSGIFVQISEELYGKKQWNKWHMLHLTKLFLIMLVYLSVGEALTASYSYLVLTYNSHPQCLSALNIQDNIQ